MILSVFCTAHLIIFLHILSQCQTEDLKDSRLIYLLQVTLGYGELIEIKDEKDALDSAVAN